MEQRFGMAKRGAHCGPWSLQHVSHSNGFGKTVAYCRPILRDYNSNRAISTASRTTPTTTTSSSTTATATATCYYYILPTTYYSLLATYYLLLPTSDFLLATILEPSVHAFSPQLETSPHTSELRPSCVGPSILRRSPVDKFPIFP